jgi:hypothetical protein
MLDPELMTDVDRDCPSALFATLAVLALTFALGFGLGYLVAWL